MRVSVPLITFRLQDISIFLDMAFFHSKSVFFLSFDLLFLCLYRTVSGDPLDQVFIYLSGNSSNNNMWN